MNVLPHMYFLQFYQYLEVCLNCLAYSFEQVKASDIDVLGETREENLKLIAQVYMELSAPLSCAQEYRTISRSEIEAALKGEL